MEDVCRLSRTGAIVRNAHPCFFNGNPDKGVCPGGDGHLAQALDFNLAFDVPTSANSQDAWRFCQKCQALFYAGYGFQGVCKAGNQHVAQGLNFVLPHDLPQTSGTQGGWRTCIKCFVLYFSAFGVESACAAEGAHVPEGFVFVLPFEDQVAAPTGGLGSNSNYFLHCFCNPIKSLSVFVDITEDMVAPGFGWSIQLNCYSTQNHLDAWQQYVVEVFNAPALDLEYQPPPQTYVNAVVNNWPATGNYLINQGYQLGGPPQADLIPAGYRFSITLSTDDYFNVIRAQYNFLDNLGNNIGNMDLVLLDIPGVSAADLAPIIAFQLNIVGPFNSIPASFTSGAGTITYSGVPDLRVSATEPLCAETGYTTAETANTFYGTLPASTNGALIQSFNTSSAIPLIRVVKKTRPPLGNMFDASRVRT